MKRKINIIGLGFFLCFSIINTQALAQIAKRFLDRNFNLDDDEKIEVFDYLDHTWVQVGDSIFKVKGDQVEQLNNYCKYHTCSSNDLLLRIEHLNELFYGTSQGLFLLTQDSLEQQFKTLRGQSVNKLFSFDKYLWFDCDKGIGFSEPGKGGYWEATKNGEILNYLDRQVWIKRSPTYSIDWLIRIRNNGDLSSKNFKYIDFLDPYNRIIPDSVEREIFEVDSLSGHIWVSASDGIFIVKDTLAYWLCKNPETIIEENSNLSFIYIENRLIEKTLQFLKRQSGDPFPYRREYDSETSFFHTLNNIRHFTSSPVQLDSIIKLSPIEKINFSKKIYSYSVPENNYSSEDEVPYMPKKLAFEPSEIVSMDTVDVLRQHSFGDFVWCALEGDSSYTKRPGVYLASFGERVFKKVPNINSKLIEMIPFVDSLNSGFFTTEEGVFSVKSDTIELISTQIFKEFEMIGFDEWGENVSRTKNNWINTDRGVYKYENKKLYKVTNFTSPSLDYWNSIHDKEYFNSDSVFFSIDSLDKVDFWLTDVLVHSIVDQNKSTFILTDEGVYNIDLNDKLTKKVDLPFEWFSEIIIDNDSIKWINSSRGLLMINSNDARRVPDIDLQITSLQYSNGAYWMATSNELFRVDPNMEIKFGFNQKETSWKQIINYLSSENTLVSGLVEPDIYYVKNSTDRKIQEGQFDFIIESNYDTFMDKVKDGRFSAEGTPIDVSPGYTNYNIALRDKYGNLFIYSKNYKILPAQYLLPFIIFFIWTVLIFGVILFSPLSNFSHNLIMNPWVRNIGSFGLFPLIVSLSPLLRNYILLRYIRNLSNDIEMTESLAHYVVPDSDFEFHSFMRLLKENRKLLLHGPSGIGKSTLLMNTAWTCANRKSKSLFTKLPIPVFVPLSRYLLEPPERIIFYQLNKYGDISDQSLSDWFLKQGDFLILIDGLNEADSEQRNLINSFTDKNWPKNFICLSSQVVYSEFNWIKNKTLSGLGTTEILEVINSYIPDTDYTVNSLNKNIVSIYSNPQNLSFGIRLLQEGKVLPTTNFHLYTEILKPISEEWQRNDLIDNFTSLIQRAFEMLVKKEHFLEKDSGIPESILIPLLENKLIVKRNNKYQFKHDLVKSFLASIYVYNNLESVFQNNNLKLDINWRSCFDFLVFQFESDNNIRFLLLNVLSKNLELASYLFTILLNSRTEFITDELKNEFTVKYGELSINASYNRR